jgi:hypothetical protein
VKQPKRCHLPASGCVMLVRCTSENLVSLRQSDQFGLAPLDLSCDGSDYLGISGEVRATRKPR